MHIVANPEIMVSDYSKKYDGSSLENETWNVMSMHINMETRKGSHFCNTAMI